MRCDRRPCRPSVASSGRFPGSGRQFEKGRSEAVSTVCEAGSSGGPGEVGLNALAYLAHYKDLAFIHGEAYYATRYDKALGVE